MGTPRTEQGAGLTSRVPAARGVADPRGVTARGGVSARVGVRARVGVSARGVVDTFGKGKLVSRIKAGGIPWTFSSSRLSSNHRHCISRRAATMRSAHKDAQ